MSHFKNQKFISTSNNTVAFEVGEETKDFYSTRTLYEHDPNTDNIKYSCEVIKNWSYDPLPTGAEKIEGKKYSEVVFKGSLKECISYIDNIVREEGHWKNDPKNTFNKIFIPGVK